MYETVYNTIVSKLLTIVFFIEGLDYQYNENKKV